MLVAVIFLLALLTIAMAVALPIVSKEIQRDREQETMQRGKQYMRGVRMYYRKFGAYPPNADALIKGTIDMHFMRKKYADLTMGTTDWKPVYLGQNKAPLAMGFFGVPLGGPGLAGNVPGASTNGIQAASSVATQSTGGDPNASNSGTAGNHPTAPSSPSWFTKRRPITTSGSLFTHRYLTRCRRAPPQWVSLCNLELLASVLKAALQALPTPYRRRRRHINCSSTCVVFLHGVSVYSLQV